MKLGYLRFTNCDLRAEQGDVHGTNRAIANRKSKIVNQNAFTMLEIAISLAVIAFALVAIIGVLPTGLRSQQETREETIVNQDGPYFLEMIRNGAHGLDHLTNFVEWIQISNQNDAIVFTNSKFPLSVVPTGTRVGEISNGEIILLALSTPKFTGNSSTVVTNTVSAYVHSLSGAAVQQGKASRDLGFGYLLTSEIMPFDFFAFSATNYYEVTNAPPTLANSTPENMERYNRWLQSRQMSRAFYDPTNATFFEVRLVFRWPLRRDFTTGRRRQVYRTMVSSTMTNVDIPGLPSVPLILDDNDDGKAWRPGFFFVPNHFAQVHDVSF